MFFEENLERKNEYVGDLGSQRTSTLPHIEEPARKTSAFFDIKDRIPQTASPKSNTCSNQWLE